MVPVWLSSGVWMIMELMLFYVHGYAEGDIQHMDPCPDPGMI